MVTLGTRNADRVYNEALREAAGLRVRDDRHASQPRIVPQSVGINAMPVKITYRPFDPGMRPAYSRARRQPHASSRPRRLSPPAQLSKPIARGCRSAARVGLLLLLTACSTRAGDWPQLLGPQRDGVAVDESLPETLPAKLSARWSHPLGQGYAGPVVVGQQVLIFHRADDQERLDVLASDNGRVQWSRNFEAGYRGGVDADTGPRCAPVVAGDRVLVFGAAGVLHCVTLADGRPLWSRDLYQDFGGNEGYFGAGSTPLVMDDHVLVNVGGRNGAGLVALRLASGETVWQAGDEPASYSSPTTVLSGKQPAALFVTRLNVVLVDPKSGRILASHPFGRRGPTVNAATPIVFDGLAFVTASYGVGAALLQLDSPNLKPVWANDETLSSQYNTPVLYRAHLFGIHGREDLGAAELRCVAARTGEVAWSQRNFGVAHLIRAADRLAILTVDGALVLADADPTRYRESARAQVSSATTRALPALAAGHLYLRDNTAQGGRLLCVRLREADTASRSRSAARPPAAE